ncbi:hypothetical protein ACJIZ3_023718 [Penstemon smallii]|uniref:Myb/SANT-like domain-containing protein n=1 Tax=Penstemon smallii TaxID=265156 RepID=A0ABD3TQS2_9LAMI
MDPYINSFMSSHPQSQSYSQTQSQSHSMPEINNPMPNLILNFNFNSNPNPTRIQRGRNSDHFLKASWDSRSSEMFIKLCVDEVNLGNRPGSHFNKTGWDNLVKKFAAASSRNYTKAQLKNKWDNLKKEWSQWKTLLRDETGLGWDHDKGTVLATDEWWARKLQVSPQSYSQTQSQSHSMPEINNPMPNPIINFNSNPNPTRIQRGRNSDHFLKASWDSRSSEMFIKLCVDEVNLGNRPGSHFNKTGWDNLVKKFATASSRNYTKAQLKNKWDNLKKEWSQWKTLLRGETGLGWDHDKGTVLATDEWWARKLQVSPLYFLCRYII